MNEHPVLDGIRSLISEFEEDTGIKVKVNDEVIDLSLQNRFNQIKQQLII